MASLNGQVKVLIPVTRINNAILISQIQNAKILDTNEN